jgi:NADH dehydrogenase
MRIAITGGTGFVGRHLAARLAAEGHDVVLVARGRERGDPAVRQLPGVTLVHASVTDERRLRDAFVGCDAVAHLAAVPGGGSGGSEPYAVRGTRAALRAAERREVGRVVMLNELRVRPHPTGSWSSAKWHAERLAHAHGAVVVRSDVIYGSGDHLLAGLGLALRTRPVFALVGYRRTTIAPVAVDDAVRVLVAALTTDRVAPATLELRGPDERCLSDVARITGIAVGSRPWFVRTPLRLPPGRPTMLERLCRIPVPEEVPPATAPTVVEGEPPPRQLRSPTPFTPATVGDVLGRARPLTLDDLRRSPAA